MKFNKWTVGLAAVGVVSLASAARADENLSPVETALSNTTLSGYVDTAATWRPGTDTRSIGGAAFGPNIPRYAFAKNDGFSLNAIDIALDKPEDESPWAAGYHVELMEGPDAVPAATAGAVALRQGYVTLRMPVGNGIDWKIGVWDTIIGYESTSSPLDPNYTRSYGYSIEPTTHTGVLATYKVNNIVSLSAGIADSVFGGINATSTIESQKAYMGSIALTAPDSAGWISGATLTCGLIDTGGSGTALGSTSLYAGMTLPTPVKALKIGTAFDVLELHNRTTVNKSDDSEWVAGLYATIQATDKLSFNSRAEYVSSGGVTLLYGGPTARTSANAAEEVTEDIQYNLWANVISRVEFRWDHAEHGNFFGSNPAGSAPAGGANKNNDFLMALNVIYQF